MAKYCPNIVQILLTIFSNNICHFWQYYQNIVNNILKKTQKFTICQITRKYCQQYFIICQIMRKYCQQYFQMLNMSKYCSNIIWTIFGQYLDNIFGGFNNIWTIFWAIFVSPTLRQNQQLALPKIQHFEKGEASTARTPIILVLRSWETRPGSIETWNRALSIGAGSRIHRRCFGIPK